MKDGYYKVVIHGEKVLYKVVEGKVCFPDKSQKNGFIWQETLVDRNRLKTFISVSNDAEIIYEQ